MKAVNQENYILELRNAMFWRYSNRDIALTLEDIHSVFEDGRERGRTEQEIAEELGTPEEFILTLAQEGGLFPKSSVLLKRVVTILVLCAAGIYLFMMVNNMLGTSDAQKNNLAFCAASACVPVLLYFVAGVRSLYSAREQETQVKGKYLLCLLVSAFLVAYEQLVLVWACRSVNAPVVESYYVIRGMIVAGVILLLVLAVRVFFGDGWYMGLFSIVFGAIGSSIVWIDYVRRFDVLPRNPWAFICVFPCVIGILLAAFIYCLNRTGRNKL